jgi:muramoyltetrapeptide carboxypeptidase
MAPHAADPVPPAAAVLPPPVTRGARVGVAALSGPADPQRLADGLDALADLGFDPVPAANLGRRHGLFAGSDDERLAAFHDLAADPSLAAVVFLRGGWGALRLLPRLDWALLARHPRAYVGYSDLTPFLAAVVRRLGLVAFHGPMVAADLARGLDAVEADSLLAALAGDFPVEMPLEMAAEDRGGPPREGPLAGGCLSLLSATVGTEWATETAGRLLFLEDVDEPLYRLDRMLTHLRLSGSLTDIQAMIFGHLGCTDAPQVEARNAGPPRLDAPPAPPEPLRQDYADAFAGPVAWGVPAGHQRPNLTLPLGLTCRLDAAAGRLLLGVPA